MQGQGKRLKDPATADNPHGFLRGKNASVSARIFALEAAGKVCGESLMQSDAKPKQMADLFVIGGGINGCGIARDAAGRGMAVVLAEAGDLGQGTSSASTKLFHGGLRYLEYLEVRLVREALREREVLLQNMPHISWPMRFVLPYHQDMRFDSTTPVARLLARVMPWLRGRRPAWLIRLGLFFYDHLGRRRFLAGTRSVNLAQDLVGGALQSRFERAFEYSDVWVDDARLVALNARDAEARGARILTQTRVVGATRGKDHWDLVLRDEVSGESYLMQARAVINAAGPSAAQLLTQTLGAQEKARLRLVKGSHIVVPALYTHDKAYFFQSPDGRIIFAIPYEGAFTLIGTTDVEHGAPEDVPQCSETERDYLLELASQYFKQPLKASDVVWTYSGVRGLYDDGASTASAATREYVLRLDHSESEAPVLSVYGGKITTYRCLAEAALAEIMPVLGVNAKGWTAHAPLPGGEFGPPVGGVKLLADGLCARYPFLDLPWAMRLVRAYGTEAAEILGSAARKEDLGRDFGATLTEAELRWMREKEFARSHHDALWRRSKLGLHMSAEQRAAVSRWFETAQ